MVDITGSVLVTGGAGFIGSALSRRLAPSVDRWVAFDSLHPQVHASQERPANLSGQAELVVGDVTDAAAWDALLADFTPDIVIHLAAETGTAQSLDEATRHASVNVVGTTQMLDAFGRHGVVPSRILLSSSRAVYGEGSWVRFDGSEFYPGLRSHAALAAGQWDFPDAHARPVSATRTVPAPTSVYGATKLAQENILTAWTAARDADLTILRLQNVYGPGQSLINSYTGIVSLFSQLAEQGKSIPIYEDGLITRDFVYIDDIASAFEAALRAERRGGSRTYDVGAGVATTILELAQEIARYHGAPKPVITGAFRDGDVRSASCDIRPTVDALDWEPHWTLGAGVAGLQEWIATQSVRA